MMRRVNYTLLDPTGNVTLLVETPVPAEEQPRTARELMKLEPATEQVGFLSLHTDGGSLRMAGGEFCGNASLCAAVLAMMHKDSVSGDVYVHVSGTREPVEVRVSALPDGIWQGRVRMPRPVSIGRELLPDGEEHPVVRFPGITHVILEEEAEQQAAGKLAADWCRSLCAGALGLMFLDREERTLKPLVYVPAAQTLFWESSCASGTTAVGAFLASEAGRAVKLALKQPGGTLEIEAEPYGALRLSGTVRILRQRTDVPLDD